MSFIHLHIHTEYSIADGLIRIEPLATAIAKLNMPAVAITEQVNLFSAVKFYEAMQQHGIKPIIGAELNVIDGDKITQLVLLCQHIDGYKNLTKLLTKAYAEGQQQKVPLVRYDWVKARSEGLIALSAAEDGALGAALLANDSAKAAAIAEKWAAIFPNRYYIELQRIGRPHHEHYITQAVTIAEQFELPVVATNNVRFITDTDYDAHEARVCINQGNILTDKKRPRQYTQEQYLRSPAEMQTLFADIPSAVQNTLHIAERCNLELALGASHLPCFPLPEAETQEARLKKDAEAGLAQLLKAQPHLEKQQADYQHRLAAELAVINTMGFAGYFLIVADFIRWAKENNIPVGPGRGSGAGSLVAYALNITTLDPLHYGLLFERFLNPERVSLPDFDIDFCMERRDEVIGYVVNKYGRQQVSQIITYNTMAAKAVIRDAGRVLGYPYLFVDKLAKLVPFDLNMTLEKAMKQEPRLKERYENDVEVKPLIDLAMQLEGLKRSPGRHAGGVVIAPKPLVEYMPLYLDEQESETMVSQFDMGDVEAVGLVKFDFLGLKTLTIIDWTLRDVNKKRAAEKLPPIDINQLPLDDQKTYALIQTTETTALFQLESDGMKKLVKELKPDVFNDLIALVALFRPGPLQSGMVDDFMKRKHGKAAVTYLHHDLEPILKSSYGIILYQEQVMEIAQQLAGYTLGAADLLRRAMGKKKPAEMAEQRSNFLTGALAHGLKQKTAHDIFDLMEKFAGYGFNKSHSAAYAMISYQTAWLKTHYPAAFMAAVLSADMGKVDKVILLLAELKRLGIKLINPEINHSQYHFTVIAADTISYGLGAIKGVGSTAVAEIAASRDRDGAYQNLFDLCLRLDLRKVNQHVLDSLIRSGAMDKLGAGRSTLLHNLPKALSAAEQAKQDAASGQNDIFGLDTVTKTTPEVSVAELYEQVAEWSDKTRLLHERDTLGFYLSGHPFDRYQQELAPITTKISQLSGERAQFAGYIIDINPTKYSYEIKVDDNTDHIVFTVSKEQYERYSSYLKKDQLIIIAGKIREDSYFKIGIKVIADKIANIEAIRRPNNILGSSCQLKLQLVQSTDLSQTISAIKTLLSDYKKADGVPVKIHYVRPDALVTLALGENWCVNLSDDLIDQLLGHLAAKQIKIEYLDKVTH